MFGKKNNVFGDKNYQMKEEYSANDLFVANLRRISGAVYDYGPVVETTEQRYIFEIIKGETPRYREVFTGFIAEVYTKYFNLPYVVDVVPFTDFFPETMGTMIPKLSLIWIQNDINFTKPKIKQKLKKEN